jgi:tetrahydromethanopterin S-methyltransferase subunit B
VNGEKATDRGITRLDKWPRYMAGMMTEAAFVFGLTVVALLIAVLARAIH